MQILGTIRFPQSSIFFIDFDKLKNHFSSSYGINDTPSSSDFVCIGLSQNKCCCYIIEAKNFDRIQNLKDEKILNKLERSLSKKLVDTLLILAGITEGKEKRLLFKMLWDKGIVYYLLVREKKIEAIIKVVEYLERKITKILESCGYKKIRIYFITLDDLQHKLNQLERLEE